MSVLEAAWGVKDADFSAASGGGLVLVGDGTSHGPFFHERYVLQPINPTASARKILSSEDRVKIAFPFPLLCAKKTN